MNLFQLNVFLSIIGFFFLAQLCSGTLFGGYGPHLGSCGYYPPAAATCGGPRFSYGHGYEDRRSVTIPNIIVALLPPNQKTTYGSERSSYGYAPAATCGGLGGHCYRRPFATRHWPYLPTTPFNRFNAGSCY